MFSPRALFQQYLSRSSTFGVGRTAQTLETPPGAAATVPSPAIHIQVLSDLHLEFARYHGNPAYVYDFPVRAEILALLGDIGLTFDDRLFDWLRSQLKRFKLVFFLSGNHEAYLSSIEESNRRLAAFVDECDAQRTAAAEATGSPGETAPGRFVLLDRTRHDLSAEVTVLGCTLWSALPSQGARLAQVRMGLNDFTQIQDFTPKVYTEMHRRDRAWLECAVGEIAKREPHRRIVVMTHHAPTVEDTSDPKHAGSAMNCAFATELVGGRCWRKPVKVWMFGHTHWVCDFERKGVRVLSNPRGYTGHGEDGFDPGMVVEV